MIRYDLINPSDPYTFEAPSHEVAAVAVAKAASVELVTAEGVQ